MIEKFEKNVEGRDFVVGDIHGCFHKLQEALTDIEFDESKDRLFSVGDLVDRGPESHLAEEWIEKPWFHAVQGNHEDMAIRFPSGNMDAYNYSANGGAWNIKRDDEDCIKTSEAFSKLPLVMEVDTPLGKVGILHAECPVDDWTNLKAPFNRDSREQLLWGREKIRHKDVSEVKNIHSIYVGHTPVTNRTVLGNHIYIDTGVCFGKADFHIERIN